MKKAVFGIKGLSILSRLSAHYIFKTAIDSMHCVLLGVVRALLVLWFENDSFDHPTELCIKTSSIFGGKYHVPQSS